MTNLILFILASWGLTHILVSGKIFETPRNWIIIKNEFLGGILTCYQCTGFWSGMFIAGCFTRNYFYIFLLGLIASGTCSFLNSIYVAISTYIRKNQDNIS